MVYTCMFMDGARGQYSNLLPIFTDTLNKMNETQIFGMIRELKHHWYEIFHHLGFSHEQLAQCKKKHPLDSELCLMEMITLWTRGTPSWKALVSVLRYQLLENEIANKVEKAHCVQEGSTTTTIGQCLHGIFSQYFCNFTWKLEEFEVVMKSCPHLQ